MRISQTAVSYTLLLIISGAAASRSTARDHEPSPERQYTSRFAERKSSVQSGEGVDEEIRSDYSSTLESPILPNQESWGVWEGMKYCEEGMWAIGAQLKVESKLGIRYGTDDTALNAVRLLCAPFGVFNQESAIVESHPGNWGKWRKKYYCRDSLLIGFQLRSEGNQGARDDTGANNIRLRCSSKRNREVEMDGLDWGEWTARQTCPRGTAVCGVNVKNVRPLRDTHDRLGDDVSATAVNIACCNVAEVNNCNATDKWVSVTACGDNRMNNKDVKCKYALAIGVTTTKRDSETRHETEEIMTSVLADIGLQYFPLMLGAKFKTNSTFKSTTGHDWSQSLETANSRLETVEYEWPVPAGGHIVLEQVVGFCGDQSVFTSHVRFHDLLRNSTALTGAELLEGDQGRANDESRDDSNDVQST